MQSGTYSPPTFSGPVICAHCFAHVWHPRWSLVDRGYYQSFCFPCYGRRRQEFTAEAALRQARALIAFEHAVLSGRVVCDGGVL
jgi:hypothetical protein